MALSLRWRTVEIAHFDSDEPAYEGLAASLHASGGHVYSLRHVGFVVQTDPRGLALLELRVDQRSHGGVLDFYAVEHQDAMDDQAISPRGPLLPTLLAASTALLGSGVQIVAVNRAVLRPGSRAPCPTAAWQRAQLPIVLVPLLASLGAVAVAFAASRRVAGVLPAAIGALALATSPLEVWCAHRVTADTLSELLVGGAALLLAGAAGSSGRRATVQAALAGSVAGLAVLAKSSGFLVAPAYALTELLVLATRRSDEGDIEWQAPLRRLLSFAGAIALVGLWWPLFRALQPGGLAAAIGYGGFALPPEAKAGSWPRFALSRPFWVAAASTAYLAPLLGLGAVTLLVRAGAALRRREAAAPRLDGPVIVPLAAVAVAFLVATAAWPARENRFLLPAYISFATGTALAAEWTLDRARRALGSAAGTAVVLLVTVLVSFPAALRSYELGPSGAYELTPLGPPWPPAR